MEKFTVVGTTQEVTLLHRGFDIVIVSDKDDKQSLLKPEEIGLTRRQRPNQRKRN